MEDFYRKIGYYPERFWRGLQSAFVTRKRALTSTALSLLVFVLMNLAARPIFSLQMLYTDILLLPEAVTRIFLYNSLNTVQMFSTLLYALLAGPALIIMYIQFTTLGSGVKNLAGILPGLAASGCLGCGAGLIGLLGLTGALALLPFNGRLITPLAILMLLYFITKSGDPEICRLE